MDQKNLGPVSVSGSGLQMKEQLTYIAEGCLTVLGFNFLLKALLVGDDGCVVARSAVGSRIGRPWIVTGAIPALVVVPIGTAPITPITPAPI
jgi:hypothetical protein